MFKNPITSIITIVIVLNLVILWFKQSNNATNNHIIWERPIMHQLAVVINDNVIGYKDKT